MFKRFLQKLSGGNTLYYPGCVTRQALPEVGARYEQLLRRAKIDFIVLPGEALCCGSPVKRAGYLTDFENLKRKNQEILARYSVRKIITNCPGCYHTFKVEYGLEAWHVTQVLSPAKFTRPAAAALTYHDPCHVGRWSGIYEESRRLLAASGWQVEELSDNRAHGLCCGGGGGLKSNFPELADAIARQRLAQVTTKRLCTACPLCYAHFKQNAGEVQVLEFSEALGEEEETSR